MSHRNQSSWTYLEELFIFVIRVLFHYEPKDGSSDRLSFQAIPRITTHCIGKGSSSPLERSRLSERI